MLACFLFLRYRFYIFIKFVEISDFLQTKFHGPNLLLFTSVITNPSLVSKFQIIWVCQKYCFLTITCTPLAIEANHGI